MLPIPKTVINFQGVKDRFRNILSDLIPTEQHDLDAEIRFKEDLGMDSLDMVELVMICEKDFFVTLPDRELSRSKTVAQFENLIFKSLGN